HLFEHMMFQESQHVPQDQFFKIIQNAGGTLNGGTSNDYTVYFEILPRNALETALWLESDRMGYLLSTITLEAFANQQDVVINEKRQRYDNRPYGQTSYVIDKNLFPENHPYNWQVIGSTEDVANASLEDIRNFFKKWYGPNNATLVIAGDFDKAQTIKWVEKYFGELKSSAPVEKQKEYDVTLAETKRVYYEDNFANAPEINIAFPTTGQFKKDAYALEYLADFLSDGKKAPLYKVIVEEKKLAPSVRAYQSSQEVTGAFQIQVRAFPSINLTDVEKAIYEAFDRFEKDGFTDMDLARLKAKKETQFYNSIASIFYKGYQLALYNAFTGTPGYITTDLQNALSVTKEDIIQVYNSYIKGKNRVVCSFVPKGQTGLIAENAVPYSVEEEKIAEAKDQTIASDTVTTAKIPSAFDRSIAPEFGPDPELNLPEIWTSDYKNGLKIYGIEHNELPLVRFTLTLKGGMRLDKPDLVGVANLMTDIMMEGTKNKTPVELEEAIDELGSSITMYTTRESIVIQANMLASKVEETFALVREILLEPRWDETEFERIKKQTIEQINRNKVNPEAISSNVFNKLIYGDAHIYSNPVSGTAESVEKITIDDLKTFYQNYFSPSVSYISVAGDISEERAVILFEPLEKLWPEKKISIPEYPLPDSIDKSQIYFVDMPDAKQSVIRIGYLSMDYNDPDYFPAYVMNYKLGGSFNGNVNLILREEKGYTYGARTGFSGSLIKGPFSASSSVRSNATLESVQIFKTEMEKYQNGLNEEDLAFTKNALLKSNARAFETLDALLGMLNRIGDYNLTFDYVKKREEIIKNITKDEIKRLAQTYIIPDRMVYLIVGDAKSQLESLKEIGFGDPFLLDADGNLVKE
ncbi:MAG: insulinase family protein, partial [Calditrichaceae bacterium]